MRAITTIASICAVAVLAIAPAAATTVDEVIAKHVKARGGEKRWSKIESIKLTGSFTAFSNVYPFTLYQTAGDRYYLDHVLDGKKVVIGYDGKLAWWENEFVMPGAQKIGGIDLGVNMREFDFPTPFFGYKEKGYKVRLSEETEYEGEPAIAVELTRPDESSETWFLDPDSYLEFARISPGSDFGSPMEQRTVYDDFREVDGVMIPHLREAQWYTRDRVMLVDNVELNVKIDDAMFAMPLPPGMDPLRSLAGEWNVAVEEQPQPGAPWSESERTSTIESKMGHGLLEETYMTSEGRAVVCQITYDRFKGTYRISIIDDVATQLDIQEGTMEDGRITVSNVGTGITQTVFGGMMTRNSQIAIFDITDDGFKVEEAVSMDGGENWTVNVKKTYTRAAK